MTLTNDRGDRGNVGIIRSPVRASILPDRCRRARRQAAAMHLRCLAAYSITSSARRSIDCGTVRPSALAVLTLIAISNLTGS
jgi:hypothetical protein